MIVELYFARNEQAIKETEIKYGKLCFDISNNILRSIEDSEECVNDTYVSVWNSIPPTRPNSFVAFLCKVVRNLSLKRLEYNLAAKRNPTETISFSEVEETLVLPDADWKYEDIGKLISSFLRQEKESARNVFIRKYFFFDSISAIAERYSFSESKVKNMLYHSRNKLKVFLKKEGIEV